MRVLQVASSMGRDWGGIERYVAYVSQGLAARGHDVVVARPPESPLAERWAGRSADLSLKSRFDPLAAAAYLRLISREAPDLVVTHFSPDYWAAAWSARAKRVPALLTRHVAVPLKARRTNEYSRLYTRFLGVSTAVSKSLVESGIPHDRVLTAIGGVPALAPSSTRPQGALAEIGIFSRLVPEKGQEIAIAAVRPPWTLHIFGDGPDRARLEALANGKPVQFHGHCADIADRMMSMDCITMPSVWDEALGLTLLEAMSIGKPIVASRKGGIPEVILDGETGLLVEAGNAKELALAWQRLADEPALGTRIGKNAKQAYESLYTVEAAAERLEEAYSTAVEAHTRAT